MEYHHSFSKLLFSSSFQTESLHTLRTLQSESANSPFWFFFLPPAVRKLPLQCEEEEEERLQRIGHETSQPSSVVVLCLFEKASK